MRKQMTRITAVLMALVLCFTCLPAEAQAASKIKLNKTKTTLYTNGTTTLKVRGTSRRPRYSSSRKSVATVTSSGKVTAKKPGTATITAKVGSKKLTCKVTVKKESPKLSKTKTSLYTNGTTTLKVSGTSRKPTFSSSRKSIATVTSSGKVTAKKPGTATITAKVGSKKLTCKVTVKGNCTSSKDHKWKTYQSKGHWKTAAYEGRYECKRCREQFTDADDIMNHCLDVCDSTYQVVKIPVKKWVTDTSAYRQCERCKKKEKYCSAKDHKWKSYKAKGHWETINAYKAISECRKCGARFEYAGEAVEHRIRVCDSTLKTILTPVKKKRWVIDTPAYRQCEKCKERKNL